MSERTPGAARLVRQLLAVLDRKEELKDLTTWRRRLSFRPAASMGLPLVPIAGAELTDTNFVPNTAGWKPRHLALHLADNSEVSTCDGQAQPNDRRTALGLRDPGRRRRRPGRSAR